MGVQKNTTMSTREEANAPRHYLLLTLAIVIGIVGVYLRFANDHLNIAANIILVLGVAVALKAVFAIMK